MSDKLIYRVRQSIKDDWERFKIYPITCYSDIDPTRYRVNSDGRVVKGEWYEEKAGLPLKVCYDKKRKLTYCNLTNIYGKTVRVYCDDMEIYHAYICSKKSQ